MIHRRRPPIFISDVRALGGIISVVRARDRLEPNSDQYRINWASGGRDLVYLSTNLPDEKSALAAANVLGELLNATVENSD